MMARFIPTYVGHTALVFQSSPSFAVHPHIRGAYENPFLLSYIKIGSSPHTWGILEEAKSAVDIFRFIPTYVGHTPP